MKPRPIPLPPLSDPAFSAAFEAAHQCSEAPLLLPLNSFDDIGTLSVMLSVAEAEQAEIAGSRRVIALIGADIRPLLAIMANQHLPARLIGLAVNYPALKAALPEAAFNTAIGMVQLAAQALKCPAYALGLAEELAGEAGLTPLSPD